MNFLANRRDHFDIPRQQENIFYKDDNRNNALAQRRGAGRWILLGVCFLFAKISFAAWLMIFFIAKGGHKMATTSFLVFLFAVQISICPADAFIKSPRLITASSARKSIDSSFSVRCSVFQGDVGRRPFLSQVSYCLSKCERK